MVLFQLLPKILLAIFPCVRWLATGPQQVLTIDFASIHIIITPANLQTCKLAAYVHQSNSFIVNQQINQTIHRFAFIRAL